MREDGQIEYWAHMLDEAFRDANADDGAESESSAANKYVERLLDGVETIEKDTVPAEYKKKITKISIPSSVKEIGLYAFSGCSGLTSVTIPDGVTEIGTLSFENCTSLRNLVIPESVTFIGPGAFENCSGLTSVKIPDSTTRIGAQAFLGCSGLTSVTIPRNMKEVGLYLFFSCKNLKRITVKDQKTLQMLIKACVNRKIIKLIDQKPPNPPKHKDRASFPRYAYAPNGKKSNLTKWQWHMVRTPQFKAWFGDWEKDPEHSSKMLDENGEPMVFWHGSSAWNPFAKVQLIIQYMKSPKRQNNAFVDVFGRNVGKQNLDEAELSSSDLEALKQAGIKTEDFLKFRDEVRRFKDDVIFLFDRNDKANAKEYAKWVSHGSEFSGGKFGQDDFKGSILQLFVNARKVLRVDFKCNKYNDFSDYGSQTAEIQKALDNIQTYFRMAKDKNVSLEQDPLKHAAGISRILKDVRDHGAEAVNRFVGAEREKLQKVVDALKEYDCVVFENCEDMGDREIQTQYVVLDPANVKSATRNSGRFSKDDLSIMSESAIKR